VADRDAQPFRVMVELDVEAANFTHAARLAEEAGAAAVSRLADLEEAAYLRRVQAEIGPGR